MVDQNYTAEEMFRLADSFFTSMDLIAAPQEFWDESMIVRPDDRDVVCHATAWDFSNRKDFRIKMCTDVTMDDLLTIHHEMGHIQYYLQYVDQPISFRSGANIAFHEAVGEVMTLSVATPDHLQKIGLLEQGVNDPETEINFLLKMSLSTIGTLPFSLALEQWRWDVFSGEVNSANWMKRWWDLKHELVGVKAPVNRTEDDFDPGAMFHIVGDYSFMRYYMRTIIQFQFHKAMCDAKNHEGPLHTCDIYNSPQAGDKLGSMLQLGSSQPWPDAMEQITGQRDIKADAIMEYFSPLNTWLQEQNKLMDEQIGWEEASGAATRTVFYIITLITMATVALILF
ncbi:putative angiotensin-converting enzyme [Apostichopus japonicus]|uniref:Angiotensin-converting enzyme n=1 Tax=Stichopus japonicus TaxID=307972 RepID=A0A2G8LP82_STIJA|nr:putative angiotensin-converting enzyme [Apostichopus japonicus]